MELNVFDTVKWDVFRRQNRGICKRRPVSVLADGAMASYAAKKGARNDYKGFPATTGALHFNHLSAGPFKFGHYMESITPEPSER